MKLESNSISKASSRGGNCPRLYIYDFRGIYSTMVSAAHNGGTWAKVETCSDTMLRMKLELNSTSKTSSKDEDYLRPYIQLQRYLPNRRETTNRLVSKSCYKFKILFIL